MTKTAQELFRDNDSYSWGNYQPIVEAFGNVAVQAEDDSYQGDTWVLYHEGERFGFLQFGWGSCSGCDALQACRNINEVQDLMNDMERSIVWFESRAEALKFFETHDWEGDYSWSSNKSREFVTKSLEYLRKET